MQLPTVGSFSLALCPVPSIPSPALTLHLFHEVITSYLAYSLFACIIIGNFAQVII